MKTEHSDIVIVGGGIIGLFCAYYLAEKGRKILILDRGRIGDGASHGNCGLLMFSDIHPMCSPGTVQYELGRQLKRISPMSIKPGIDIGLWRFLLAFAVNCNERQYTRATRDKKTIMELSESLFDIFFTAHPFDDHNNKGFYTVCRTRAGVDKYGAYNRQMERYGLAADYLDAEELLEREPAVNDRVAGGFFHPADHSVRPDGLVKHVREILEKKGVQFKERCPVTGIRRAGGHIVSLETPGGSITGDRFLISAGAWSTLLMKHLGITLPVQPGKGYSITMNRPGICPGAPCYCYERSVVATPFKQGFRLGGTMEFSGWDDTMNPKRLENIKKAAPDYLKEPFGSFVIEEWASLRPMTPDDLPIIGWVPGSDNTLIATGHGMLGLTLGPGTGHLAAQMFEEDATDIPLTPFSLERFRK